jgi:hypothetical protein
MYIILLLFTVYLGIIILAMPTDFKGDFICTSAIGGATISILIWIPISITLIVTYEHSWLQYILFLFVLLALVILCSIQTANIAYRFTEDDVLQASIILYLETTLGLTSCLSLFGRH